MLFHVFLLTWATGFPGEKKKGKRQTKGKGSLGAQASPRTGKKKKKKNTFKAHPLKREQQHPFDYFAFVQGLGAVDPVGCGSRHQGNPKHFWKLGL